MSTQSARRTILESIYTLRRRRSVLPLTELRNHSFPQSPPSSSPSQHESKSLIQGQRIPAVTSKSKAHPNPSIARPRPGGTPGVTAALQHPSLLHGPNSKSFGIRNNYAATNELYTASASASASATSSLGQSDFHASYFTKNNSNHLSTNAHVHEDDHDPILHSDTKSDLVVVLDLDECLIHSQFLNSGPEVYRQDEHRPQSHAFHAHEEPDSLVPSLCDSFRISLPDGDLVHVNKRPHLDTFLQEITQRYETHIFTAAMEVYAKPLLDQLDPNQEMFRERYYREECTFDPSLGVYVKDLQRAFGSREVDVDEKRVVLIDNNPMSFLANPLNGILVCNFYDDPKDETLRAVMDLLLELEQEEDVRPFLDDKFGLKDALKEAVSAPNSSGWM